MQKITVGVLHLRVRLAISDVCDFTPELGIGQSGRSQPFWPKRKWNTRIQKQSFLRAFGGLRVGWSVR